MEARTNVLRRATAGTLVLALVSLLLILQVGTAAPAAAGTISVAPSAGRPGSSATVTGNGFILEGTVGVCWDSSGCSNLGSATAGLLGNFSISIAIPADADTGPHTIFACGNVSGCGSAPFQVLSAPETSTTTTPPDTTTTTTTTAPTTTTTSPATTTTRATTTTTPPGPTTVAPSPTTTATNPATTTAPPPTVTTTTTVDTDGRAGASSSTSTTEGTIIAPGTSLPGESASPFALDVEALVAQLFATDPATLVAPEATTGTTLAGGLAGPLGPGSSTTVAEGKGSDDGIDFSLGETSPDTAGFRPRFGIWLGWLAGIVGLGGLALVFDERRRRKR